MIITKKAYAKINLFLEVCNKREDGYHNIDSIMQTVSLCDDLTFDFDNTKSGIVIESNISELNSDSNLVYKAIKLYFSQYSIDDYVKCSIVKNIPIGAGLAGGSSDCAETLLALNEVYNKASENELLELGKTLGADVPFCMKKGIKKVGGIGEELISINSLPECYFVIACGDNKKSTGEMYKQLDLITNRLIYSSDKIIDFINNKNINGIANCVYNAFELVTKVDERIKPILSKNGAIATLMSGSGPSIFGLYTNLESANKAKNELTKCGIYANVASTIY